MFSDFQPLFPRHRSLHAPPSRPPIKRNPFAGMFNIEGRFAEARDRQIDELLAGLSSNGVGLLLLHVRLSIDSEPSAQALQNSDRGANAIGE